MTISNANIDLSYVFLTSSNIKIGENVTINDIEFLAEIEFQPG